MLQHQNNIQNNMSNYTVQYTIESQFSFGYSIIQSFPLKFYSRVKCHGYTVYKLHSNFRKNVRLV